MLPIYYETEAPITDSDSVTDPVTNDGSKEKAIIPKTFDDEEFELEQMKANNVIQKKPCAIVVLSNIQNPSMQSLLRKYKYDANGILIPSSVKYFIKLPQSLKSPSVLMPLNDKAFSPLGGFVRYYKEVPPIPHAW
ncbi:jg12349 [Pararge aegeria aegeria]|uniref:Jg12349 protein n=2 Tax=Pararge aegeria TaxID=116150 RepID=A0A8S4RA29_9NEOP|nr:jg12349 [Pararge aegeria aegeria]